MASLWDEWQPGMRVVVRYRLHGEQFSFSDALGELLSIEPDVLVVDTRRGPVQVPKADIVLGKRVPPPPARRRPRQAP